MEGTRLRILQLLQRNGQETVESLARNIGLAPATIRRHLDILQRDRLVDFQEVRKRTGRPEYSFYLTEEGQETLPKDYDRLLNLVVGELASLTPQETSGLDGAEILHSIFQRLSRHISEDWEGQLAGHDLDESIETLINILREQKFSPELEIDGDALRVKLLNCPFRAVALKNKAICSYDYHLISTVLGGDVRRAEWIQDGFANCMYVVQLGSDHEVDLAAIVND